MEAVVTASRSWLTGDDLIALSARIAAELDKITGRAPSIAEDFNRCLSTAGEAIGREAWDFNASELDELAEVVCDAIAGRSVPASPPGSWGSVNGGKWHRTYAEKPSFTRTERSACNVLFRPVNVTWGERPNVHPSYICKKCDR